MVRKRVEIGIGPDDCAQHVIEFFKNRLRTSSGTGLALPLPALHPPPLVDYVGRAMQRVSRLRASHLHAQPSFPRLRDMKGVRSLPLLYIPCSQYQESWLTSTRLQGYLDTRNNLPYDPAVGLYLGPHGGPGGIGYCL